MSYELCVDIGGTFTDLCLHRSEQTTQSYKSLTTPDNLTQGVFDVLEKAAENRETTVEALLDQTHRVIHGSTIATNAIIENTTANTALVCTDGFRDTLTLREGGKNNPYDWNVSYPDPYVPRSRTYGVTERINAEGEIATPLNKKEVRNTITEIREKNVDAVAISLLWAHRNPSHERAIGDLFEKHAPELDYSLSSEVCPIIREYRRTSATAINASLYSVVTDYLSRLQERFEANGYTDSVHIITANGGVMQAADVVDNPIWLADAGPTMLPVASREVVATDIGDQNVIALDMGGTSLDIGLVDEGTITRSRDAAVGDNHLLGIEKVEVETVGSGGGSVAWVDDGGLLRVGPESAGADPGPACYMRGGERPTVTDAALVLGYLNEEYFLGGEMDIDKQQAVRAIEEGIGDKIGLSPIEAAHAIYTTANQKMVNGIKRATVERGIDPRQYVLSGGGGALGIHVVSLAREFQAQKVLLPQNAGVVSAMGGLVSELRRDFSESYVTTASDFDACGVNDVLDSLHSQATEFLDRASVASEAREVTYYVEARYPQQNWELSVELPFTTFGSDDERILEKAFHRHHESMYGFNTPEQDVEFLNWRVEGCKTRPNSGVLDQTREKGGEIAAARKGTREAFFDGEMQACSAYRTELLHPGHSLTGPAILESAQTTIVIPPESQVRVTDRGNFEIQP